MPIVSARRQIGCICRRASSTSQYLRAQRALIGTEAVLFSHARVREPLPPPSSTRVYLRLSIRAGGADIVIFTRPRSIDLSYLVPHWPVCLLTMRTQLSGSET